MSIGTAFVDILGDTSRTATQVERDMNRVVAVVSDAIDPAEIRAAVADGTTRDLTQEFNRDLRAVSAALQAVDVNAQLSPESREQVRTQLRDLQRQIRSASANLRVQVDEESAVRQAVEAARAAQHAAPTIEIETNVDGDRVSRAFKAIGGAASAALPAVGALAPALIGVGSAVPLLQSVVATVAAIGPAAALAAPAILTVQAAVGTVKLAMVGVSDAVAAAFDPSDPQAYADALKKLSPNAREFVRELHSMQPALHDLQQQVQNRVFDGLADSLKDLAKTVLPTVRSHLLDTGSALNDMAALAADAASNLGSSGTLGKALDGTTGSLLNLTEVPAQIITAFGQLAAAAAPSLQALSIKVAQVVDTLSGKLSAGFSSGGLQAAIQGAVSLLGQLLHIAENVGKVLGDVFAASTANGGNLISTLSKLTDSLVQVFANPEVQSGLTALFSTVGMLSATAMPLLAQVLGVVAQALVGLAPGVQTLISALGAALQPIIAALGPLLLAVAQALSGLLTAISPLFPVIGLLISQLGPILTPIVNTLTILFQGLAPIIAELATILASVLGPILGLIPKLLQPFLDQLVQLSQQLFPLVLQLLTALEPSISQLVAAFVQVFDALAPLLPVFQQLAFKLLAALIPLLPPIIAFIGQLAAILANNLALALTQIVVPAIKIFTSLLNGDAQGAVNNFKQVVHGVIDLVVREFVLMPIQIAQALGTLGTTLYNIGTHIIGSLIDGIKSKLGALGSVLGSVTDFIADHKGPIEKDRQLLVPAGQAIMSGLIAGIESQQRALGSTLAGVTGQISGTRGTLGIRTASMAATGNAANSFAIRAPSTAGHAPIVAQVFIGNEPLSGIVRAQLVDANTAAARRLTTGARI